MGDPWCIVGHTHSSVLKGSEGLSEFMWENHPEIWDRVRCSFDLFTYMAHLRNACSEKAKNHTPFAALMIRIPKH